MYVKVSNIGTSVSVGQQKFTRSFISKIIVLPKHMLVFKGDDLL